MATKRLKFSEVFQSLPDGSLEVKKSIQVDKVTYQSGAKFQKGVVYGGIDFYLFRNRDLAIEVEENSEGPLRIIGFLAD